MESACCRFTMAFRLRRAALINLSFLSATNRTRVGSARCPMFFRRRREAFARQRRWPSKFPGDKVAYQLLLLMTLLAAHTVIC